MGFLITSWNSSPPTGSRWNGVRVVRRGPDATFSSGGIVVARFQPSESIRKEMQRRCQVGGVVFADVAWDPQRQCLCTYELWGSGEWHLEKELRDQQGEPRQVHEGDIKDIESRMMGRRSDVDNWYANFKERRELAAQQRKLWLHDHCYDTAREMNKRAISRTFSTSGSNVIWDDQYPCQEHGAPQKASCQKCKEASRTTFFMRG